MHMRNDQDTDPDPNKGDVLQPLDNILAVMTLPLISDVELLKGFERARKLPSLSNQASVRQIATHCLLCARQGDRYSMGLGSDSKTEALPADIEVQRGSELLQQPPQAWR